jgi:hypothetical protein
MPLADGWNSFYLYNTNTTGTNYAVASGGKDGSYQNNNCGATTDFNDDIIYSDGSFLAYPSGAQK